MKSERPPLGQRILHLGRHRAAHVSPSGGWTINPRGEGVRPRQRTDWQPSVKRGARTRIEVRRAPRLGNRAASPFGMTGADAEHQGDQLRWVRTCGPTWPSQDDHHSRDPRKSSLTAHSGHLTNRGDQAGMDDQPKRRICRTVDESWEAGVQDAKNHRPLSPAEITRIAALLRPYLTGKPGIRRPGSP